MKTEEFEKRMKQHRETFDNLWSEIVKDTNEFIEKNPHSDLGSIERFTDDLCLSGAWVQDRLNGFSGLSHQPTYKKSLTKKIRKALGYTL